MTKRYWEILVRLDCMHIHPRNETCFVMTFEKFVLYISTPQGLLFLQIHSFHSHFISNSFGLDEPFYGVIIAISFLFPNKQIDYHLLKIKKYIRIILLCSLDKENRVFIIYGYCSSK